MFAEPTPEPPESRPQSVQLTLRVAMLGAIAVVCFAILFFRLWVIQVLSAERYANAAAASLPCARNNAVSSWRRATGSK